MEGKGRIWTYGRERSHTWLLFESFHNACHCWQVSLCLMVWSSISIDEGFYDENGKDG